MNESRILSGEEALEPICVIVTMFLSLQGAFEWRTKVNGSVEQTRQTLLEASKNGASSVCFTTEDEKNGVILIILPLTGFLSRIVVPDFDIRAESRIVKPKIDLTH